MDNNAKITVTSYKSSGKWYSTQTSELDKEHAKLWGFKLQELFQKYDDSIQKYSGLSCGFEYYLFTIEVDYPVDVNNFCQFFMYGKNYDE